MLVALQNIPQDGDGARSLAAEVGASHFRWNLRRNLPRTRKGWSTATWTDPSSRSASGPTVPGADSFLEHRMLAR